VYLHYCSVLAVQVLMIMTEVHVKMRSLKGLCVTFYEMYYLKSIFLFLNMSSMVYKYLCQLSDLILINEEFIIFM